MAEIQATRRVNKEMLSGLVGSSVRLVGRVVQVNQGSAVLEASDGGQVTVHMLPGSQFGAEYVEVIGEVNPDLSLRELANASFGDNFHMQNYNELVLLTREFPQLFG